MQPKNERLGQTFWRPTARAQRHLFAKECEVRIGRRKLFVYLLFAVLIFAFLSVSSIYLVSKGRQANVRKMGYQGTYIDQVNNSNMSYLQFIATCTLAILGTMIPLSAVHLYVPAWFRVTFDKTRVSLDWIIPGLEPFRKVHVIFGRGFPVELQNNLTSSASLAKVSWEIYTIDGGTKNGEVTMRTRKSLNKPFWINSVL